MSAPLAELQRAFLAQVRAGDDGMPAHLADGRLPPATGFGIYRHAYAARLREALENDHPLLGRYLGDALWEQLCRDYTAAHPSRVRSLRDFGAALPDFLTRAEPFAAHPLLAELAAFERRLLDSFDAADAGRLTVDALATLPPARWPVLRLRFHPSLQLLPVRWNSVEIWQALKRDEAPPAADSAALPAWALWRDEARISRFRSLPADETETLQAFLEGGDFAFACEQLARHLSIEAVPARAFGLLQQWLADGWIAGFDG